MLVEIPILKIWNNISYNLSLLLLLSYVRILLSLRY